MIKIGGGGAKVQGSLPVSEYVEGMMAKYAIRALWILVGAVLAFLLTQFFGLSTIVHELNGKQDRFDQTVNLILDERKETYSALLELQKQLMEENQKLRDQINNQKK